MTSVILFIATVLIWGTTWIAITFQVGDALALVSVFYRFALAAAVLLGWLAITGRLRAPQRRVDHLFLAAQGFCLFSMNFVCFYYAALYLPSGLLSVIFSLATIYNAVNARIFFAEPIAPRAVLAAALGSAGLTLIFSRDLLVEFSPDALRGLGLAALGTLFFSLGNMVSRRNSAAGLPPALSSGWGMAYGVVLLAVLVVYSGADLSAPMRFSYFAALFYLAVFGSVLAFTFYLTLVDRIGSSRAAYATVMFPVVALTISTFAEGYVWDAAAVIGVALTMVGNIVMFAPARSRRAPANA